MKVLNSVGPNIDPWGTLLVTGCQSEKELFTTTLWVQPVSQIPPTTQTTCLVCSSSVSLAGGCGELYRKPCRNPGGQRPLVLHQLSRLRCCRRHVLCTWTEDSHSNNLFTVLNYLLCYSSISGMLYSHSAISGPFTVHIFLLLSIVAFLKTALFSLVLKGLYVFLPPLDIEWILERNKGFFLFLIHPS